MMHEQVAKRIIGFSDTATLGDESKETVKVSNRLHDNVVKAVRSMWRPLLCIGSFILLFIAYFFVLSKHPPITKVTVPESKSFEKPGQTSDMIAPPGYPNPTIN